MAAFDIQLQMGLVHESMKTAEVQIQNARLDLDKALEVEKNTLEGLTAAKARVVEAKEESVVSMTKALQAQKDLDTVSRFVEQSKSRRMVLEATVKRLVDMQSQLSQQYASLTIKLAKAENNVVPFGIPGVIELPC
jgi:hypothetical protein